MRKPLQGGLFLRILASPDDDEVCIGTHLEVYQVVVTVAVFVHAPMTAVLAEPIPAWINRNGYQHLILRWSNFNTRALSL